MKTISTVLNAIPHSEVLKKGDLVSSGKLVVLVTNPNPSHCGYQAFAGVVIHSDDYDLGHFSETWSLNAFKPFTGSLNLKSE